MNNKNYKVEILGLYEEIKKTIKSKYFTIGFYIDFVTDYTEAANDVILHRNVTEEDRYRRTKKSDFYKKDSAAYCHFLEVFNSCLIRFRIQIFADPYGNQLISTRYESFPSEDEAKKYAKALAENAKVKYFEVNRVA